MTAFLLAVGTIFVAAAACGSVAARLRLPRVVGEMGAGLVLGQTLLGHAWPHAENYLFGERVLSTLKPLGLLVVLLYVALVGAELDRSVLLERTRGFVGAAAVGLAIALGGGAIIGVTLSDLAPAGVPRWTFYAFLTGAILVTAVPVLARILDETGLTGTTVGAVTLALSIADDFIAFSIVAVAIAVASSGSLALALAGTAALAAITLGASVKRELRRRFRTPAASALGIGVLALVAGGIDALGASTLVVAFLVGALFWRRDWRTKTVPGARTIRALVPLYIVYAGLSVDMSRLATPRLAVAIVVVTAVAVGTKIVASLVAGQMLRLSRSESVGLTVLRNTRGLTELVALNLGFQAGLLSQDLYTVFFSMALLTTAASGTVALRALRPLERDAEALEDRTTGLEPTVPTTAAVT